MPAYANDVLSHKWITCESKIHEGRNGHHKNYNGIAEGSAKQSSPPSPNIPLSMSPVPKIRRIPSLLHLGSRSLSPSPPPPSEQIFHPRDSSPLFHCLVENIVNSVFYFFWEKVLLLVALWLSFWMWIIQKCTSPPLELFKIVWTLSQRWPSNSMRQRVVLISGGSTVQALHLARNFYSAGARVVVCEVEGRFSLARFSTAVSKFYSVPRPDSTRAVDYVDALCGIVQRENVSYYIPVSATNEALYDALAKPQLELMNCVVFCPTFKKVLFFDDLFEVLSRCRSLGLTTPVYHLVTCRDDVHRLYDSGLLRASRHFMTNVGPSAVGHRVRQQVPPFLQDFRTSHEISHQKPWLIVQDVKGDHYVTCTTVKDSLVVGNVTCRMENDRRGLVPVEKEEIAIWIQNFFTKLKCRGITGHFSFRFGIPSSGSVIIPLGCKVGVSLPYICFTSVHPRIVWKPCKHFTPQTSGPLVARIPRYWMHDAVLSALRHPSVEALTKLVGTVLDKREALFVHWDPLPYCAYYHLQLPLASVFTFLYRQKEKIRKLFRSPYRRTLMSIAS